MADSRIAGCFVVDHPLVRSKIAVLRSRDTSCEQFRRTLHELTTLIAFEATRDLLTKNIEVETPLARCAGHRLAHPVTIVPILRAGLGMAEALWDVIPEARVGHVGMYRDEKTLRPKSYYFKTPPDLAETDVFLVDPMLATGHSASDAATELKSSRVTSLRLMAMVGCVEGVTRFRKNHPDVPVYLAVLDEHLNDQAYILPGLGDAGDRYFGT
jgi:uracil phosphoribosyltransferase